MQRARQVIKNLTALRLPKTLVVRKRKLLGLTLGSLLLSTTATSLVLALFYAPAAAVLAQQRSELARLQARREAITQDLRVDQARAQQRRLGLDDLAQRLQTKPSQQVPIKSNPKDSAKQDCSVELNVESAKRHLQMGDFKRALTIVRQLNDDQVRVQLLKAKILLHLAFFDSARDITDSLISQDTESAGAYLLAGDGLRGLNKWDEADEQYSYAIDLETGDHRPFWRRAQVRLRSDWDVNAAVADAVAALEQQSHCGQARLILAQCYQSQGQIEAALRECQCALDSGPQSVRGRALRLRQRLLSQTQPELKRPALTWDSPAFSAQHGAYLEDTHEQVLEQIQWAWQHQAYARIIQLSQDYERFHKGWHEQRHHFQELLPKNAKSYKPFLESLQRKRSRVLAWELLARKQLDPSAKNQELAQRARALNAHDALLLSVLEANPEQVREALQSDFERQAAVLKRAQQFSGFAKQYKTAQPASKLRPLYRQLVDSNPRHELAILAWAELEWQLNEHDEALKILRSLLVHDPENQAAKLLGGMILSGLPATITASTTYDPKAQALDPVLSRQLLSSVLESPLSPMQRLQALTARAYVLAHESNYTGSKQTDSSRVRRVKLDLLEITQLKIDRRHNPRAVAFMALALRTAIDVESRRQKLRLAEFYRAKLTKRLSQCKAWAKEDCDHGTVLWNRRKYQPAIEALTRATEWDPRYVEAYRARFWCYFKLGEAKHAGADLNQLLELQPRYADVLINFSGVSSTSDTRVLKEFTELIETYPMLSTGHFLRGLLLLAIENHKKLSQSELQLGIDDLTRALTLNPKHACAFLFRGALYTILEQFQKAAADFDKAEALAPGLAMVHFERAKMLARRLAALDSSMHEKKTERVEEIYREMESSLSKGLPPKLWQQKNLYFELLSDQARFEKTLKKYQD